MKENASESWENIVFNRINFGQQMLTIVDQSPKKVKNLDFGSYKWNKNSLVGSLVYKNCIPFHSKDIYLPKVNFLRSHETASMNFGEHQSACDDVLFENRKYYSIKTNPHFEPLKLDKNWRKYIVQTLIVLEIL